MGKVKSAQSAGKFFGIWTQGSRGFVELSINGVKRMTGTKETLDHEGRISRLEGIIEEIRARLARIEADLRDMRCELSAMNERLHRLDVKISSLWVGVVIIIGLLTKIAFFD